MSWFGRVQEEFCPLVLPFAGKPIQYVEIGVWTGNSARYVCENVLTHPDARGVGIDHYPPDHKRTQAETFAIRDEAARNLAPFPKWQFIYEPSQTALRKWDGPIDLLYIDGDHNAPGALGDFCLAWPFLTPGAVVIFDDYGIGKKYRSPHVPAAVEAVKIAFGKKGQVILDGAWQFAFRVT